MTDDTLLRRKAGLEFTRLDDAHVAIDSEAGYCYNLNPTAARVWTLLAEPASVAGLVESLAGEYGVPVRECRDDVVRFLEQMCEAGLIAEADGTHVAASA